MRTPGKAKFATLFLFYCLVVLHLQEAIALTPQVRSPAGLIVSTENKWPDKDVQVCWKQPKKNRSETRFRKIVREVVEREYTIQRTGIHFVGWMECEKYHTRDIVEIGFRYFRKDLGFARVGGGAKLGYPENTTDSYSFVSFSVFAGKKNPLLPTEDSLKETAIHEFGHVAGLVHEDNIRDNWDFQKWGQTQTSAYDTNSLMSYTFEAMINERGLKFIQSPSLRLVRSDPMNTMIRKTADKEEVEIRITLSSGDLHALRCLYVYEDTLRERICRADEEPWRNVAPNMESSL